MECIDNMCSVVFALGGNIDKFLVESIDLLDETALLVFKVGRKSVSTIDRARYLIMCLDM